MGGEFRRLDDWVEALPLFAHKAARAYPFLVPDADVCSRWGVAADRIRDLSTIGLYASGQLQAAAAFGVFSGETPADFGLIQPGDGVIAWLTAATEDAAGELLDYCRRQLPARCFACPEFAGFGHFSLFRSGMLPEFFTEETAALVRSGWQIPASEKWGCQERLWFMMKLSSDFPAPELPENCILRREERGELASVLFACDSDQTVGECQVSPAILGGRIYPRHVYIGWLHVADSYRGKGLGGSLLCEQLRWARINGAEVGVLTTHSGRPAHKLYRRLGFSLAGTARAYATPEAVEAEG